MQNIDVTVKLYGLLRMRSPVYDPEKGLLITLTEGADLHELLKVLGIDREDTGMVLLDGKVVRDITTVLADNQRVDIFSNIPHGG